MHESTNKTQCWDSSEPRSKTGKLHICFLALLTELTELDWLIWLTWELIDLAFAYLNWTFLAFADWTDWPELSWTYWTYWTYWTELIDLNLPGICLLNWLTWERKTLDIGNEIRIKQSFSLKQGSGNPKKRNHHILSINNAGPHFEYKPDQG